MNDAFNQPHNQQPGRKPRRRKRGGFSSQSQNGQNQGQGQSQSRGPGRNNRNNRNNRGPTRNQVFVGPMDHSYRNQNGSSHQGRFRNGSASESLEPMPPPLEDPHARIFAFLNDLFF